MASNTINPNAKDYDKYDFSGYELTPNDKNGYDWTDSSGNKHSLYSTDKNGSYHSITDANGNSNVYYQNGTRDNEYIRNLSKGAKKAYKAQSKAPKTGITQQATQNLKNTTAPTSTSQVIVMTDEDGKPRNVGTTTDPNAQQLLTGKSIANSYEAIANANVGDFWIDSENNIHVATQRDINYSKQKVNEKNSGISYSDEKGDTGKETSQPRTTTPEESSGKGSDERIGEEIENTRKLLQDPKNYKNNYQAIIDSDADRKEAEALLSSSEGKERPIRGIIPSFLAGEYGNYHKPQYEKKKRYYIKDSVTGEVIDVEADNEADVKRLNNEIKEARKKYGAHLSSREDGKFDIVDKDGYVYGTFDNADDAVKWMDNPYELSDKVAREQHYVTYNGNKMRYDTKEQADAARKTLADKTKDERKQAWYGLIQRLANSAYVNAINNASDFAGEGRPLQSLHSQDMNQRLQSNNELYYSNQKAKNDIVNKFIDMANAGLIDLNNLTNEQMARIIGTIGQEKASQIINTLKKQELDKFMSMDYWQNWTDDQKNALSAWFAQSGQGPQTDSMIALASGKASPRDFANKWKTETRLALAEKTSTLQRLEEEVEKVALENKLTSAQADVIKELVGEQLRNAKLTNDRQIQAMVSDSADSLAKVIDAIVPF